MLCLLAALALAPQPADLIVTNARVWTDGKLQAATSFAVKDGRFTSVGDTSRWVAGPSLDAGGKVIVPGLIDAHAHLTSGGTSLLQLQLREASGKDDFLTRIKDWSDKLGPDEWVRGRGWSAESWPEKQQPTRDWIDPITNGRPAYLVRMDGHSALANSAALKHSGITRDTPSPPGGVIDKGPDGEPSGMLRETAMSLVKVPAFTQEDQYKGLTLAVENANRNGITAASDICSPLQFALARRYASGSPTIRLALYGNVGTSKWEDAISQVKAFSPIRGWAEARGLKAYMDGSLGSRTAYMHEPYTKPLPDQKELRGVPMPGTQDGSYQEGFKKAADAGLQVIVHAIGDQANHDLLNMYAQVPGVKDRRYRVEHVQHLLPGDIERFAELGVIPSMQPYHKADDGRYCDEVIGEDRSETSYTFASLLKSGAKLAFGSDWSVVTINPWEGINAAVTGRILTGNIWMPHENITVDQALTCYTTNAAYAMGWEKELGRIANGYRADFVILDRSPFEQGVDLASIKPAGVYVEGRKIYGN